MFGATFYHFGAFLARVLPLGIATTATNAIGTLNYWMRWKTRRMVAANLDIIHDGTLSTREKRRLTRRLIMNFSRCIHLFLKLPFLEDDFFDTYCDFSEFEAALSRLDSPNFILATAHVGPWELGGWCLVRLGHRMHTVALDHPSPSVARFFSQRRRLIGMQAHPLKNSFPALKKALERGDSVALVIDRSYGKTSKRFTLFGVESDFPLGHLVLSARCGVPVMTGAIVFDGRDRYRYVHGGIHRPSDHVNEFERLGTLQERCLRDLESIIRDHSDQWFHFMPLKGTDPFEPK